MADFTRLQTELESQARAANNEEAARNIATGRIMTRALYLRGRDIQPLRAAAANEPNDARLAQFTSVLAMLGDIGAARAHLPRLSKPGSIAPAGPVVVARAYVTASEGKSADAVAALQTLIAQTPRAIEVNFMIGDLREKAGQDEAAIASFRQVIQKAGLAGANPIVPGARLRLAGALLKKGDTAGAKEQLDVLLDQWKDADRDFPLLAEAKTLRAKIK